MASLNTKIKTPCIGICSATSQGDLICRGCLRYDFEVDNWHHYDTTMKQAVMQRIHALAKTVIVDKLRIVNSAILRASIQNQYPALDSTVNPYILTFEAIRRGQLATWQALGLRPYPTYNELSVEQLSTLIKKEWRLLAKAHFDRYINQP